MQIKIVVYVLLNADGIKKIVLIYGSMLYFVSVGWNVSMSV